MKQKIYISSKITGLEKEVYTKAFNDAEQLIIKMGHTPINPLKHVPQDISYDDQMHICLSLVDISDVVMMVGDWVDSPGATRELIHGAKQEKKILYYEEQKEMYDSLNHLNGVMIVGRGPLSSDELPASIRKSFEQMGVVFHG